MGWNPADEQAGINPADEMRGDWKRSKTLVASSFGAAEETSASAGRTHRKDTAEEPVPGGRIRTGADEPTLLYGGGRNAPLTLVKATLVKSLEVAGSEASGGGGSLPALRQKAPSLYASCYSDDNDNSSADEFRSANTSFDDPDPFTGKKRSLKILAMSKLVINPWVN